MIFVEFTSSLPSVSYIFRKHAHMLMLKSFFKLVDQLDALKTYNWGVAVYNDLIDNLSSTTSKYHQ